MRTLLVVLLVGTAARADDLYPLDPSKSTKSLPELLAQLQGFKLSDAQRQKFLDEFQKKSPDEQLKLMKQLSGMVPPQAPAQAPVAAAPAPPAAAQVPPQRPGPNRPPRPVSVAAASEGGLQGVPPGGPRPEPMPGPPPTSPKTQLQNSPGLGKFADLWEKNVGPLDQTPELQQALLDMAKAGDFQPGGDGKGAEDFRKFLEDSGVDSADLKTWFDGLTPGGGWKLPETGLTAPSAPTAPSIDFGGLGTVTLPDLDGATVVVLIAVAVAVFLGLRFLPAWKSSAAVDLSRAAWPLTPEDVVDRRTLVTAFEFISLHLCGDAARVWHHRTIAGALRTGVIGAAPVADRLADLYELARYAPPDEPLPAAALADARRCLGVLAGAGA